MSLYVGCNYHPHDWSRERRKKDIKMMKEAQFTTVRLGHLCWDSYEPKDGIYTFEWFDECMDDFLEAGIGVVLDLSTRPAPTWVHSKCPGCDIYGPSGTRQASLHRYMEDVTDLEYQKYALRFIKKMINRYKSHPALMAFGLCNEQGAGFMSHSPYTRKRFIKWLEKKYETIDALNHAWQTQRWSRRVSTFSEIEIPDNELTKGAPEEWLDWRRFISDGYVDWLEKMAIAVKELAPGIAHSSNHYSNHPSGGFDYLGGCEKFVDYPGIGYYPYYSIDKMFYTINSEFLLRITETGKPLWCLEYQSGRNGICCAPKNYTYMLAMHSLINRVQMVLGWTWRTMLGGKEQYHYGLLGHDGMPLPNYYDYMRIASDYKKLQKYGFPYLPVPDIAVAYNYDSGIMISYESGQYRQDYNSTHAEVYRTFFDRNKDYNVVDLRKLVGTYKLLIVPNHCVMEQSAAETIRNFVKEGGSVIMTGYSAILDETGTAFSTSRPGRLVDVFGARVAAFFRADMLEEKKALKLVDGEIPLEIEYYEELKLFEAKSYAEFTDGSCAVSVNHYGKGKAYYMTTEVNSNLLGWLVDSYYLSKSA